MERISSDQLRSELMQFIGTEAWHRHWTKRLIYTDGMEFFCEQAGCFWLLDIIGTEIFHLQKKSEFLLIKFDVADGKALISTTDGNQQVLFKKRIKFTDAPEGEWSFYLTNDVVHLPSEY